MTENIVTEKRCTKCTEVKPRDAFHYCAGRPGKLQSQCKKCANRRRPGRKQARNLRQERNAWYRRRYGITLEFYEALLRAQDGLCAICQEPPLMKKACQLLSVDHDHRTNQIRGLLCRDCNAAIGMLGDTLEGVRRAVTYLEKASQP